MKTVTRILPVLIAFVIVAGLSNCSKDSQADFSNKSTNYLYTADGTYSGRNSLSTGAAYNRVILNSTVVSTVPALCGVATTKNFIKNSSTHGTILVGNDATDYYITVNGNSGWMLKEVKMFAGEESNIPVNPGNGAPVVGQYPVNQFFSAPYPANWSIKIAIADLGADFWVSVRAIFVNAGGFEQTIWSEGTLFNAVSTASKFEYEQQVCVVNEGCAYGQGYWFGNGNQSWPDVNGAADGHVTIGGEHYTRDEARAIWWANNGNCPGIPDAKKAFAFIASIKLSGTNVIGNVGFWNDVATVDNWLAGLDRLSNTNICNHPSMPSAVKDALGRIGDWIDGHSC